MLLKTFVINLEKDITLAGVCIIVKTNAVTSKAITCTFFFISSRFLSSLVSSIVFIKSVGYVVVTAFRYIIS